MSASIQDVLKRYKAKHSDMKDLPSKACFQMNDTHPTIAVAELWRPACASSSTRSAWTGMLPGPSPPRCAAGPWLEACHSHAARWWAHAGVRSTQDVSAGCI